MAASALRVLTVVGARPQFIKTAVVGAALARAGVRELLVHTGQHYDAIMSAVFFDELGLPSPTHHLGIGGLSHGAMTGRMLEALEKVMHEEKPDWVVVYGDTNSTLAGALAAAKLDLRLAHIEAGMRSFIRRQPEEINRRLTDHMADLHFVTSENPQRLLQAEGIVDGIHVVGDVMYEAALLFRAAAERTRVGEALGLSPKKYGLLTFHRAENTDDAGRLRELVRGVEAAGAHLPLIFPAHPRTRAALGRQGISLDPARVRIIDPVGYLEMQSLEQNAALVITDSGGVQKEAFFHSVPCVTLRERTEWTETVELGWNTLVGTDSERIVAAVERALRARPTGDAPPVYGDGTSGDQIARRLLAR
jgi:UDP-GlcNAc3NAcA epimerase